MPPKNSVKEYHENSYYHLYNRGVAKLPIFLDEQDYKTFLSYLKIYLEPPNLQGEALKVAPTRKLKNFNGEIKLVAYCLMPNHFHFQVYQTSETAINRFIQAIGTKYSMYFNRKYKRVGTIFQGVYKAVMVTTEAQLLYLSKYIHRNPLEILPTGSRLVDYPYSSYPNYLGRFNQLWVSKDDILGLFSRSNPEIDYQSFVEETDERDLSTIKSVVIEEV